MKINKWVQVVLVISLVFALTACETKDPVEENGDIPVNGTSEEIKEDSATFLGLIDQNSIEVHITGTPIDVGTRAFRINENVKQQLEELEIEEGDEFYFRYEPYAEEHVEGQYVIVHIERLPRE